VANTFDIPPIYDPIANSNGDLSPIWMSWISAFYETLVSFLTEVGIYIPEITEAERDTIVAPVLRQGLMIINTDLDLPQIYLGGSWKTVTVT